MTATSPISRDSSSSSQKLEAAETDEGKKRADELAAASDDNVLTTRDSLLRDISLREGEDILALQDVDPALNLKMHLVNNVSSEPCRLG